MSRVGQWVRGDCPCGAADVLVYETFWHPELVCAECARAGSVLGSGAYGAQPCDACGAAGAVWRDPSHRRNEYFCVSHHAPDALVARPALEARVSKPLGTRERDRCAARGVTDCLGEVKWRGPHGMSLCNKHAGKVSWVDTWNG